MINIKIFTNLNGIEENKKIKNMIKRSMENNVFCLAPWTHLYVDPNGDCMPCCISSRNEETNFGNIYNLSVDKIEKFKLKMLEGKKIESCESCYKQQQTNDGKSYRDSFYYNFKHILNELNYKNIFKFQEILYLDFRFSNKCNFACRTCSANYSSRWEKAIKIENENKIDYSDFLKKIKDLILNDTLKHIYFAGGEPLIMDEQWEILNFIIDNNKQDNFELIYNTNLSVIKYKIS
jgi:MoaA/NifB/PqqE/SkfB family radical SAM enzyme